MQDDLQQRLDETGAILDANVRTRAKKLGLTMTGLAAATGITRSHLYAILDGTKMPRLDTLVRIAVALDTDVWRLLQRGRSRS